MSAVAVTSAVPTVVPAVPVAIATPLALVVAVVLTAPLAKDTTPEALDVKVTATPDIGLPF
jgi:spore maturation protein SpmB